MLHLHYILTVSLIQGFFNHVLVLVIFGGVYLIDHHKKDCIGQVEIQTQYNKLAKHV